VFCQVAVNHLWQIEIMNILSLLDERARIAKEKERIEEKLKKAETALHRTGNK